MIVYLFKTIHHVLQAEKTLHDASVPCELIPTPETYSLECGMSIQIEPSHQTAATTALEGMTFKMVTGD